MNVPNGIMLYSYTVDDQSQRKPYTDSLSYIVMTKSITLTLEVPEWVDEIKLRERVYDFVRELSDRDCKIKRLKELISKLNLDERDLEKFEKVREEVWKERKKEYGL